MLFSLISNMFPTHHENLRKLESINDFELCRYTPSELSDMRTQIDDATREINFWALMMFIVGLFMGEIAMYGSPVMYCALALFFFMSLWSITSLSVPLWKQKRRLCAEFNRKCADLPL